MPPKRKLSRPRTLRRHAEFHADQRARILDATKLTTCRLCGATKREHHICPTCGGYSAPKGAAPAADAKKAKKPAKA